MISGPKTNNDDILFSWLLAGGTVVVYDETNKCVGYLYGSELENMAGGDVPLMHMLNLDIDKEEETK